MITVKTAHYNDEEIEQLYKLFGIMEKIVSTLCSHNTVCSECKYKHLCKDVTFAREYTESLRGEMK